MNEQERAQVRQELERRFRMGSSKITSDIQAVILHHTAGDLNTTGNQAVIAWLLAVSEFLVDSHDELSRDLFAVLEAHEATFANEPWQMMKAFSHAWHSLKDSIERERASQRTIDRHERSTWGT